MFKKLIFLKNSYFNYFKKFIGIHMYGYIFINFLIGLLDGLGLAMFIPLLAIATNSVNIQKSSENSSGLEYLIKFFNKFNLEISLVNVLIIMISLFVIKGIIFYVRIIYLTKIRLFAVRKIRLNLVDGLQNLSYHAFTQMDAGKIQNNMVGETGRLITALQQYFNFLQHFIMLLTYVSMAYFSNWQFSLMVALGGILSNVFFKYINKLTKSYSKRLTNIGNDFNGSLIQSIQNFKYLKATDYITHYSKRLSKSVYDNEEVTYKLGKLGAIAESLREPMIIVIISIVIVVQVQVLGGDFSNMLVSLLLLYRALAHLVSLQNAWNTFLSYSASMESVDKLNEDLFINKELLFVEKIDSIDQIKVDGVSLKFGNQKILDNVSLTIPPKKSIAFVGESGAGKTTLANVICGLQPIDEGKVFIGKTELYKSNLPIFRQKVGYITQEPVIFDDTIYNNVTFWAERSKGNIEKFNKVMEMVSLSNFINDLEAKEDTRLGNNGILISGGQKQRVSIARELYKDVNLLILDEATSALDSETEKYIKENIDLLQGKCTIIIIAHRLSTIKNVDKIFILEKGKIKDEGNFNELLLKSEKFNRMVNLQEFND